MPDLVWAVGNVPEWGAVALALGETIRGGRLRRANDFVTRLQAETGLTPEELREAVDRIEELEELVASLWNTASQSVDEDKRLLLARAAAAGIEGNEGVPLSDLRMFADTLQAIEAPHMKLLAVLTMERHVQGVLVRGGVTPTMIREVWPAVSPNLDPLLATVIGEGMVRDDSVMNSPFAPSEPTLNLSTYGARFLRFVESASPQIVALDSASDPSLK